MTTHLTFEQMQNYSIRRVPANELGRLTEHLHGCRTCYGSYLTILQRRFPIEIDFEELGGMKSWHLQGQVLMDYVEARMSELDFDYASLHIKECSDCEQRVNDALTDWLEYDPSIERPAASRLALWARYDPAFLSAVSPRLRAAAVFVLLVVAVIIWTVIDGKWHEQRLSIGPTSEKLLSDPPAKEAQQKGSNPGLSPDPVHKAEKTAKAPTSPAHSIATSASSELDIESTLIAKNLVMPAAIELFDKSPSLAVRGHTTHVESFAVISPFSTLIPDEQPTFMWTALTGATGYVVSVYDSKLRLVSTSQPLTETHWSLSDRLFQGQLYTWTVTALRDGKEIIAPALPTRAEFRIVDKSRLLNVSRRIARMVSHAARGVILAEAGLLDEAEREFRTHLRLSPGDARAKTLLETIESWRRLRCDPSPSPAITKPDN